ncbi:histidine kinase [Imbroritus primus]|uniref:histidine kinase n=1 Tax=Imbroritus primus TaxID=3058603 RepID=UPI0002696569
MATQRAPLSYLLLLARQRVRVRHWAIVVGVALFAALALLAQPVLTAAWTHDAVRFIADATALQQRAALLAAMSSAPSTIPSASLSASPSSASPADQAGGDAARLQWLADARTLLADVPFREAMPATVREDMLGAQQQVAAAALATAEELDRHLRIDIMVRIALFVVAAGGLLIGLRLRRALTGSAPEVSEEGPVHAGGDASLQLVERMLAALSGPMPGQKALEEVAQALVDTVPVRACGICLSDEASEFLQVPALFHAGTLGWAQLEHARGVVVSGPYEAFELPPVGVLADDVSAGYGVAVAIVEGREVFGHLFLVCDLLPEHPEHHARLAGLAARHLAVAIGHAQRTREGRRVALIEERTAMARELHDSLAQSLSFSKIQVSRLQAMLERGSEREAVAGAAEELRDGLNGAYRKLRELITTFRAQINVGGLTVALDEALEEYGARSSVVMLLDNRLKGCQLSANEEFHVVQIVREALSNIVRHARATQATVKLAPDTGGEIVISVEDDGLGIDPAADAHNRHGTSIMRERALSLGGALSIMNRPEGGCQVLVRFRPGTPFA